MRTSWLDDSGETSTSTVARELTLFFCSMLDALVITDQHVQKMYAYYAHCIVDRHTLL